MVKLHPCPKILPFQCMNPMKEMPTEKVAELFYSFSQEYYTKKNPHARPFLARATIELKARGILV